MNNIKEKAIKGLECCKQYNKLNCDKCPYDYNGRGNGRNECTSELASDALVLLKKQKTVSAHWNDDTCHWIEGDRDGIDPHTRTTGEMIDTFSCSWCGFYQYWKTPFCPNCGAKMESR